MSTQKSETSQTSREDDDFDVDIRLNAKPAEATGSAQSPLCSWTCNESCGVTCSCINC